MTWRVASVVFGIASVLAVPGCASLDPSGLWLLPPHAPPPRAAGSRTLRPIAALGTASVAALGSHWFPGQGPLDLGHVLTSVDESYPLLSAVRQERIIAEAKQLGALGAFDLQLRGGATWAATGFFEHHTANLGVDQLTGLWGLRVRGGYRLGTGDFDPTFDGGRKTNHGGEFSVGARLPLLRDGSIDAARRGLLTATLDREIAESEVARRRLRFERGARVAYWRWVAAGLRIQVANSLLALADERQVGLETRVRRGDLPEIESIDNLRLVVRRQALLVGARRDLERASIALSLFLRDEGGRPVRPAASALPFRFPEPARPSPAGLEADLESALLQRPDLLQLAQSRGRVRVEQRYASNQLLPQLDVFVSGSQDRDGSRPTRTKGEFELTAGLEFGFPLQNRRAKARLRTSRARIVQLTEQERYLRDEIEASLRDTLSVLSAAYRHVAQARRVEALAKRVERGERRRFALGDSNVLRLNLREEAAAEAALGVIRGLQAYWVAVARYRAAMGAPTVDGAGSQ